MDSESIRVGSVSAAVAILGEDNMKIIKEGRKKHFFVIRFQCHRCGCIFEADDSEYTSISKDGICYAIYHCPCCDERLVKFNIEKTIKNWGSFSKSSSITTKWYKT